MSVSSGSSTPVAPNSSVEYTSEDSDKCPCYVLGQKISGLHVGEHPDGVELGYADKYQPFACVLPGDKIYVGIVGELTMRDSNTVESALMIVGPRKVVNLTPGNIFNLDCELLFPKGYGKKKNAQKNRVRFSVSKIMREYWNGEFRALETDAASAEPQAAAGN